MISRPLRMIVSSPNPVNFILVNNTSAAGTYEHRPSAEGIPQLQQNFSKRANQKSPSAFKKILVFSHTCALIHRLTSVPKNIAGTLLIHIPLKTIVHNESSRV